MAKNTKQIGLMQQRRGKLNELPKQLANSQFGFADDANRLFIGNPEHPTLEERYKSNTFPYGNVEVLTEFSENTEVIKYIPGMNGKKLYQPLVIQGTTTNPTVKVGSSIFINGQEVEFGVGSAYIKNEDYDYLVLKYEWEDGYDLDTKTKFINLDNIVELNDIALGYHEEQSVPVGSTISNSVLYWAGDNSSAATPQNPQTESILINRAKLFSQQYYNDLPEIIRLSMEGCWFKTVGTQPVRLIIEAYKGGTMAVDASGKEFINNGGSHALFENNLGQTVSSITITLNNLSSTLKEYVSLGYIGLSKESEKTNIIITDENNTVLPTTVNLDAVVNQINLMVDDVFARNYQQHIELLTVSKTIELEDGVKIDDESALEVLGLTEGFYDAESYTGRPLQEVLDDRLSIKSFDVEGNGKLYDGNNINNAFVSIYNIESSNPKELFFPADTYITNTSLYLMTNTYLVGEGIDRTIVKIQDSSEPLLVLADNELKISTDEYYCQTSEYPHNILVEKMTFDITSADSYEILYLNHCKDVEFRDCKFIVNGNQDFILSNIVSNMKNVKFNGCIFEGNETSSGKIELNGSLDGLLIINSEFKNIQGTPLVLNGYDSTSLIENGIIADNKFENCGTVSKVLVNANVNTRYISLVKTLVDEDVLNQINDYKVFETASALNYCDTHYTTEDNKKFLRYNFYSSVYDYVSALYNKYGHEALKIISENEYVNNWFELTLGDESNDGTLSLNAVSQTGDVEIGVGRYGNLQLGKNTLDIREWTGSYPYNALDVVRHEEHLYICAFDSNTLVFNSDSAWKEIENEVVYEWSPAETYAVDDVVEYENTIYYCNTAHTSTDIFESSNWTVIGSSESFIIAHKDLDLANHSITNSLGDIVFKPSVDSILVIDDENYVAKIADKPNALATVQYINDVVNSGKRLRFKPETIEKIINETESTDIPLLDFDSALYGNEVYLKDISVNLRKTFLPISNQILNNTCVDWTNRIQLSNATEYEEDDIISIRNPNTGEIEFYQCIADHEETITEPTEYANFLDNINDWTEISLVEANSEGFEEYSSHEMSPTKWFKGDVVRILYKESNGNWDFVDDTYTGAGRVMYYVCKEDHIESEMGTKRDIFAESVNKGYWEIVPVDCSNVTGATGMSGWTTEDSSINITPYIDGSNISTLLTNIEADINVIPDLKYICIKSIDNSEEPEETKWLYDLDDVDSSLKDSGGIVYPDFQTNHLYNYGDIVTYNNCNYVCIVRDDNNDPSSYTSSDSAIDLHCIDYWEYKEECGYDYHFTFEKNMFVKDSSGHFVEESYKFEHNFADHVLVLCLYDKNGNEIKIEDMYRIINTTPVAYVAGTKYVIGDYITNDNETYIVSRSYVPASSDIKTTGIETSEWEDIVQGCVLKINSLTWAVETMFYESQIITYNNKYYKVLISYTSSTDIEEDIEAKNIKEISKNCSVLDNAGEFLATIGFERIS